MLHPKCSVRTRTVHRSTSGACKLNVPNLLASLIYIDVDVHNTLFHRAIPFKGGGGVRPIFFVA